MYKLFCFTIVLISISLSNISCRKEKTEKPNILIIYTDDQGYGDVSALNPNSKILTPNIDHLAEEGMVFTDGHAGDAVCTPSRYDLLTGRYSWRTRLKKGVLGGYGKDLIKDNRMTLASLLKENGYQTAMVGKWHLNMQFPGTKGHRDWTQPITDGPTEKGFDYYFGISASMNYGPLTFIKNNHVTKIPSLWTHKKFTKDLHYAGPRYFRFIPPYDSVRQPDDNLPVAPGFKDSNVLTKLTNKSMDYLKQVQKKAKNGHPFFLYLAMTSPHLPHCPAPEFVGKSTIGPYGDFVKETDYRIGQILDKLEEYGLTKNTLVIFTSDNGAETNYRSRIKNYRHYSNWIFKGGKRDIYEGGHRVPFIVRWPRIIKPGRICNVPVSQLDLLRTFADILNVNLPDSEGVDSYSILPLFKHKHPKNYHHGPIINHSVKGYFAIQDGKWKLDMFRGSGGSLHPVFYQPTKREPPFELYNLKKDVQETKNVYTQHPEIVHRLTKEMTNIVERGRSTPGKPQKNVGGNYWKQLTWIKKGVE